MAWRVLLVWLLGVRLALAYFPLANRQMTGLASPAGSFNYAYGFQPASSLVTGIWKSGSSRHLGLI